LIKPTQQSLNEVCEYKEKNRPSPFFNHLSTVSEGIGALGWVTIEPKPAPYVGELRDSSQFYANRVIKEFKDK
jgi:adenylyl cyclase-associated protein